MAKRELMTPPNNSFKHKEEVAERENKPVFEPGSVMETKKSLGRKLAETFVSEDAHSVSSYIFSEVIVPMIKDMIFGAINQGTETLLWGRGGGGSYKRRKSSNKSYNSASYQDYYSGNIRSSEEPVTRQPSEITFASRKIAADVLDDMKAVLEQYGNLSILDYHDIIEQNTGFRPSGTWADNAYGWTDLSQVRPEITRGGRYILTLPKTVPVKND